MRTQGPVGTTVRYICLADGQNRLGALRGLLNRDELTRMNRLDTTALRDAYAITHGSVRVLLAQYSGVHPRDLRFSRRPQGKPETVAPARAAGVHWNLSTSGDWALLGISPHRPVGVDLERIRVPAAAVLGLARYFPRTDRQFLRSLPEARRSRAYHGLWVRKEAWAKARGLGVVHALRQPVADGFADDPGAVHDLAAPTGYVAAVCLAAPEADHP
ncbi:4'-phosphopantetheinyl transferase superfamily protein [Streptomyces sp. NPDC051576]|uniref:4'-phosphopantetheinyl transferase family protein n=1 Tax=Streptomyces sp. NPDC051576 TaxID=3155803 RepID=UPI003445033C